MIPLREYLKSRILQQQNRKMMIPRYLAAPGKFIGREDFSMDDIPKIEEDIAQCKAALKAINYGMTKTKVDA